MVCWSSWGSLERVHDSGSVTRLTERPSAVVYFDLFAELTGHDGLLTLESDGELFSLYRNIEILPAGSFGYWDLEVDVYELLLPSVGQC